MKRSEPARGGFTLIELLISVGIIAILATFALDLTTRLTEAGRRIQDRINAVEDGHAALARWRQDVALAGAVIAADDGRTLTIARGEGNDSRIVYSLDDRQRLVRTEGDRATILAQAVGDLRFTPNGRGWRAQWVMLSRDGIQTWRRPIGGLAAPLLVPAIEREPRQ